MTDIDSELSDIFWIQDLLLIIVETWANQWEDRLKEFLEDRKIVWL